MGKPGDNDMEMLKTIGSACHLLSEEAEIICRQSPLYECLEDSEKREAIIYVQSILSRMLQDGGDEPCPSA